MEHGRVPHQGDASTRVTDGLGSVAVLRDGVPVQPPDVFSDDELAAMGDRLVATRQEANDVLRKSAESDSRIPDDELPDADLF